MKLLVKTAVPFLVGVIVIYGFWFGGVLLLNPPEYILPHPARVVERMVAMPGILLRHTLTTTIEFSVGFVGGLAVAVLLACLAAWSRKLDALVSPLMVILQSVPKVGLAPLFVIWFGYGLGPKIVIAGLISFFPIFVNLAGGMKATDQEYLDYGATLGLGTWSIIYRIRLPFAMPFFFAALKMAAIYSVVGAIVGEFVGADKGLGYLIIQGDLTFDSPLLFAALHILVAIGIVLYLGVTVIESRVLRWQGEDRDAIGFMVTA